MKALRKWRKRRITFPFQTGSHKMDNSKIFYVLLLYLKKKPLENYVLFSATCRFENQKLSFFFKDRGNFDLNARKFRILSRRKNIWRQDNVF